jgi:predicted O-methyltransferase YrrM
MALLQQMEIHPESPGKSSWGTRNVLFSFILSLRPKVVLEIGAHIGSGTVVMGSALKANNFGRLYSLEPQDHYFKLLCEHVSTAGLESFVTPLKLFSTDEELPRILGEKADLIFLDANHSYSFAAKDIAIADALLSENGLLVLDDVGPTISAQLCTEGRGGVRQALLDYVSENDDLSVIFLEPPFWLNPCGIALACKQRIVR